MIKRIIVLAILFSMILHCASRIGFLSYLYKQRHEIAYTVGLIAEIPIAMCSSNYHINDKLTIQTEDENTSRILPLASEINLYFVVQTIQIMELNELCCNKNYISESRQPLNGCPPSVFHPPALLV